MIWTYIVGFSVLTREYILSPFTTYVFITFITYVFTCILVVLGATWYLIDTWSV